MWDSRGLMHLGALLTEDFLREGIRETHAWQTIGDAEVDAFVDAIQACFDGFPVAGRPNETNTENRLIKPVLEALGWRERIVEQVPASKKGRADVPDLLLFAEPEPAKNAIAAVDNAESYRRGTTIVESKRWERPLDRLADAAERRDGVPSTQILRYLSRVEVISDRQILWGILTNGRHWRLYWQGAKSRAEEYLELDLPAIMRIEGIREDLFSPRVDDDHARHWIKVFYLIFRRQAFTDRDPIGRTFHEAAVERGREWEAKVTAELGQRVFQEVFPQLIQALYRASRDDAAGSDLALLEECRHAAMILLYRLLFLLSAEDRGLLPKHDEKYDDYGLHKRVRQSINERLVHSDTFSDKFSLYWRHVIGLCRVVDEGDPSIGIPPYNGGLFSTEAAPLLERVDLSDAVFAPIFEPLSYLVDRRGRERSEPRYINYRDLSVEHLGSIYERLLEFEPELTSEGTVGVVQNNAARRTTGSFYTPEQLVGLIVDYTLKPRIDEILRHFRDRVSILQGDPRPVNQRLAELQKDDPARAILDLRICDPAMGSGHFLVRVVDELADRALEAIGEAEAAETVPWTDDDHPYVSPVTVEIEAIRSRIHGRATAEGWTLRPGQLDDRQIVRRIVLKRSIYGVDKNPMAVELAKVSLWLHTFTVGAPLSFLDHHLACGDSLFGERVRDVLDGLSARGTLFINQAIKRAQAAADSMEQIERQADADIEEVASSRQAYSDIQEKTAPLDRLMTFFHALRWMGLDKPPGPARGRETLEKRRQRELAETVGKLFDGQFGDPLQIIADNLVPAAAPAPAPEQVRLAIDPPEPIQVDLLPEAPQVTEAERGRLVALLAEARALAVREGFLNWQIAFPGVWTDWSSGEPKGGFDAVVGNPPYVRQERLGDGKPVLKQLYRTFAGTADLYVYFYERGLALLKPGGAMSYVVTNKWFRANYATELRRLFAERAWVERVVDFGHARQFFTDADVFPCIIVARRPAPHPVSAPAVARVTVIPSHKPKTQVLPEQIAAEGFDLSRERLTAENWLLEPPEVLALMDKIRANGVPLKDYAGVEPQYGIKTGLNEAFLIDTPTRDRLVAEDPNCKEIIKPYLRGQDIKRWTPQWAGLWMIVLKSSANFAWPWSRLEDRAAEEKFSQTYPSLYSHLAPLKPRLQSRQDQGTYWWELRSCTYYDTLDSPKIVYQEIQYSPRYALDQSFFMVNNKVFLIPSDDLWLFSVLNSSLMWWYNWRNLQHMKDEALSPVDYKITLLPIAEPSPGDNSLAQGLVERIIKMVAGGQEISANAHAWSISEFPDRSQSLADELLVAESFESLLGVIKEKAVAAGEIEPRKMSTYRDYFKEFAEPYTQKLKEMEKLERSLSDLVISSFGLTQDDVKVLWDTAPPRMPLVEPMD